jgi:hypothetical protein
VVSTLDERADQVQARQNQAADRARRFGHHDQCRYRRGHDQRARRDEERQQRRTPRDAADHHTSTTSTFITAALVSQVTSAKRSP